MLWLWVGGAVMAVGTVLAAFPGRRRRPIDPVSAPVDVTRRPGKDTEPLLAASPHRMAGELDG